MKNTNFFKVLSIVFIALTISSCGSSNNETLETKLSEASNLSKSFSEESMEYGAEDICKITTFYLDDEIFTENSNTINAIYEEIFGVGNKVTIMDEYNNIKEGCPEFICYNQSGERILDIVCAEKNIFSINSVWYKSEDDKDWNDITCQIISNTTNVEKLSDKNISNIDKLTVLSTGDLKTYSTSEEIETILNVLFKDSIAYTTSHTTENYSGNICEVKAYEKENLKYNILIYYEDGYNLISVNDVLYHYYDTPDYSSLS